MQTNHEAHGGSGWPALGWGASGTWSGELRRRLDVLTLTLLTRLAEAPRADLQRALLDALGEIGPMLDFDQAMLFACTAERDDLYVRLAWSAPSVALVPLPRIREGFPELMARTLGGELVEVRRVADLRGPAPRDFASLRALGLRSALVLPLGLGGAVDGALALVSVGRAPRWPAPLAGELRTLGHALSIGLHRHGSGSTPAIEPAGVERRRETGLTDRQLEVLRLLSRGQTMKQIAERLAISPRTVAFHKARIKEAMGAATTAELLRKALEASVLEP